MAKVKLGMPFKSPGLTPERFGKFDMVIPYTIDGMGPFEVRIPYEEYDPRKAETLVVEEAKKQLALYGKEIAI